MGEQQDRKEKRNGWKPYEDIISLPHHISAVHPQMPAADRAAQFSPFSALTGYGEAIRETGRFTGARVDLDEDARQVLDRKLQKLLAKMKDTLEQMKDSLEQRENNWQPQVKITYFQADNRKEGGIYRTAQGVVKKIDLQKRQILLWEKSPGDSREPGTVRQISLDDISGIEELL